MLHTETRQRGRFAGFSLYVSKTGDIQSSTLCYKDGQLPPLNFTTICAEYGRYVIYYNERLSDVSYPSTYEINNVLTELCEVSVKGKLFLFICVLKHKLDYRLQTWVWQCNYWFIYFVARTINFEFWILDQCLNVRMQVTSKIYIT